MKFSLAVFKANHVILGPDLDDHLHEYLCNLSLRDLGPEILLVFVPFLEISAGPCLEWRLEAGLDSTRQIRRRIFISRGWGARRTQVF